MDIIEKLSLGTTYNDLLAILGTPLKDSVVNGYQILRYSSNTQRGADFIYLKEGKVVQVSQSVYADNKFTQFYINLYGIPELSIRKYSPIDSLRTTIHYWFNNGAAVVAYGDRSDSQIERIQLFQPQSQEIYFSGLGQNISSNERLTLNFVQQRVYPSPSSSTVASPSGTIEIPDTQSSTSLTAQLIVIGILLVVLILTFLWVRGRKKPVVEFETTEKN